MTPTSSFLTAPLPRAVAVKHLFLPSLHGQPNEQSTVVTHRAHRDHPTCRTCWPTFTQDIAFFLSRLDPASSANWLAIGACDVHTEHSNMYKPVCDTLLKCTWLLHAGPAQPPAAPAPPRALPAPRPTRSPRCWIQRGCGQHASAAATCCAWCGWAGVPPCCSC